MKIMMVGDTHGSAKAIRSKIDIAKEVGGIDRMIVLGDFGLWWGYEGVEFIDEINEHARANNFIIYALPGNHENYDWWNSVIATAPTSKGFACLRTKVLLSPRVHEWRWAGKQFAIAGGAVSVDREWRQKLELGLDIRYDPPRRVTPTKAWSVDEQLTDEEVYTLIDRLKGQKVDYLLTHDCSNKTPFHGRLKPDIDSQVHRQRIDRVLKGINPKNHFHGHMHTRYDWMNFVGEADGEAVYVQTYGLECNDDPYSWGVLDTETDEFAWSKTVLARGEA